MRSPDLVAPERLEELLHGATPEGEREARLQGLVRELRADASPAPEPLRVRVRALREPASRRLRFPRRRLALVLVPALLVAVLSAAVLFGGRSSDDSLDYEAAPSAERAIPPAIKQNLSGEAAPSAFKSTGTRRAGAVLDSLFPSDGRARDIDMSIELRLPDADRLSDAANEAMRVTRELGGFVVSSSVDSRGAEGQAQLALRIPVGNLEDAVVRLSELGTITEQRVAMEDLQTDVDSRSRRIGRLRSAIRIAELRLESGTLDAEERLRVEIQLERLRDSLDRLRRERQRLLREAATAELSLTLHTRAAPAAREEDESPLEGAARDGLDFLAGAGSVALFLAIVLSPVLFLPVLLWLALRSRSRRVEERLLEQPRPAAPSPQPPPS
jgi:hypothetical protein